MRLGFGALLWVSLRFHGSFLKSFPLCSSSTASKLPQWEMVNVMRRSLLSHLKEQLQLGSNSCEFSLSLTDPQAPRFGIAKPFVPPVL